MKNEKKKIKKLSLNTNELVEATSINRKFWFMLKEYGVVRPALIGRSLIWPIDEVETFLNWSKGMTIANEYDLAAAMQLKPYPRGK